MLKNKIQLTVTLIYLVFVAWWITIQPTVDEGSLSSQRFVYSYGSIALFGSVIGFLAALRWGGYKTILGKALLLFSLGLLLQEAGQLILNYYIYVKNVDIPYPSWGDVAYFGSTLSYIGGAMYLAKAAGVRFSLKTNKYKLIAFAVPATLLIASYWIFLNGHEYEFGKPLSVFLDFGYPMGDAIYISLAIVAFLLSRKLIGGIMRSGVLILLLALVAQYIADFSFLYQSSRETYVAGKLVDLLYLTSYFVMGTAVIKFFALYDGLKKKPNTNTESVSSQKGDN